MVHSRWQIHGQHPCRSAGFHLFDASINGETLNPQKMFYTVWVEKDGQQAPYVFKADMYWAIEEDATEVPYSFNYGSWDGNHNIYFQDGVEECATWTKVGIQSIYYGGGECNKSSVVWVDTPAGIADIESDVKAKEFRSAVV